MNYRFKQLTERDLHLYNQMLDCFGREFDEPDTYNHNSPDEAYIRRLLRNDGFIALVALHEGSVIGALTAYVLEKFEQQRSEVYIYDLAVSKAHRRKGVATGLIHALKPIAQSKHAWVVFVQADEGDEPATCLYTKLGVKERVLHFDIRW